MKRLLPAALSVLLAGCGGYFFYPDRVKYSSPGELGIPFEERIIDDGRGPRLVTWLIEAGAPKALVVHLHGNAQNMSSHLAGVYWLPAEGYSVLLADYRGYGGSPGSPSITGVNEDVARIFRFARGVAEGRKLPLLLLGQSLGGATGLYNAAQPEFSGMFDAIVIESAFSTYRSIVREKLAMSWASRVLGAPFVLTIPDRFSPLPVVANVRTKRLAFVHGDADLVVDRRHSELLHAAAPRPAELWIIPGAGHNEVFGDREKRKKLVEFFDEALGTKPKTDLR